MLAAVTTAAVALRVETGTTGVLRDKPVHLNSHRHGMPVYGLTISLSVSASLAAIQPF